MKIYEYLFARGIFKMFETFDEKARLDTEKEETEGMRVLEERSDKESWVYDTKKGEMVTVLPKKSKNFVTINFENNKYSIILSKKPYSIDSELFDYPWQAEARCSTYANAYREQGEEVTIRREIPMYIADNDLACPYCKNSQEPFNWVENTLEQELLDVPIGVYELEIDHIHQNYLWCPVCNEQVDKEDLLRKGEEWKEEFLNEFIPSSKKSPYMQKRELDKRKEKELKKQAKALAAVSINNKNLTDINREIIVNPFNISKEKQHNGLLVKVVIEVASKGNKIRKEKWIKANGGIPIDSRMPLETETTYINYNAHMAKRDKNNYPIRYCPINKLRVSKYSFYKRDNAVIDELTRKYHSGIALPVVCIFDIYEIKRDIDCSLVEFAYDLGLTHVPVIIYSRSGSNSTKKEIEKELRENFNF